MTRMIILLIAVVCSTSITWTQFQQQGDLMTGAGTVGLAMQGRSVSLSADGNTAIIGGDNDGMSVGASWIFTRANGVWTQQGPKLVGTGVIGAAMQGSSVSLSADGNTALVGGYGDNGYLGAVWVFTRANGVWTQQGPKLVGTGAISQSYQGNTVSLSSDGNTALVGGYFDNAGVGAVWIFTRTNGVWTQQGTKIIGTGTVGKASQGKSVSLSADGNTALVGGYFDNGILGAVWVFTRANGVWTQQGPKLVGTGVIGAAMQGSSVSLSADGNTALVGGHGDSDSWGAAWVFTRSNGLWTQMGGKLATTSIVGLMGIAVSLSADGNTAMVGGTGANGAWLYVLPGRPRIVLVSDIANDQGGHVRITWTPSVYDNVFSSPQVASYSIFRTSAPSVAVAGRSLPVPEALLSDSSLSGYDYIGDVPALQQLDYQMVVPTLEDSSASRTPYFTFIVVARTTDLDWFYLSVVDSGYSVDNLSPIPPAGLLASVEAGPQVDLTWNSPTDLDVGYYKVYRSTTSGFTPASDDSIGTSNSTDYTDTSPIEGSPSYYRIIAVDIHDNQSNPSNEVELAVTVNKQFSVQAKWNIISVPLTMSDYTKTLLFPTAMTGAFAYEDGYYGYATLENGRGYWMKFSGGETISQFGLERTEDTVAVFSGWNMVGSLSRSTPVSNIGSIPGGIVTSSFYQYDVGYTASTNIEPGKGYWVKVSQAGQLVMTSSGMVPASNRIRIENTGELPPPPPDGLNSEIPDAYALEQNYPNPFNPVTSISYALPVSGEVLLTVFNMLGQEVAVLVNEMQEPGDKTVSFDASNLPSGVYTYRITAGTFTDVKKMLLIK
jgi:hypothetical protein